MMVSDPLSCQLQDLSLLPAVHSTLVQYPSMMRSVPSALQRSNWIRLRVSSSQVHLQPKADIQGLCCRPYSGTAEQPTLCPSHLAPNWQ